MKQLLNKLIAQGYADVGETRYKIYFKKMDDYGLCVSHDCIIIRKGLSKRETYKTLIHELHHAFEFEAGKKISHKTIYLLEKAWWDLITQIG